MEDLIITEEKIEKARRAGVCKKELQKASQLIGQQYKDPYWLYCYAKDVIRGRWLDAEPYIMKDPEFAYLYARNIICGRWLEAEPYIMKSLFYTYWYITDVVRGRWPEAEIHIRRNGKVWEMYQEFIDWLKDTENNTQNNV